MKEKIINQVESLRNDIVKTSKDFISINSVNPRTYGPGEKEAAEMLESLLKTWKFDEIKRYDAPDDAVPYGYRPNIVAIYKGTDPEKTIWFMTHMDKVPAGDLSLWDTDPFTPVEKDGKLYGRGSEDNGSSLVASIYGVKALMDLNIRPKNNIGIMLVSDEETGSKYGIQYVVEQKIFGEKDLFFVPDGGNEDGTFIEIAEKSGLKFKVITEGKQAHASMPNLAINAHRHGMKFNTILDEELHRVYNAADKTYEPEYSSFEMTIKEKNVENINTIPGTDIVHWDCRVLPNYDVHKIIDFINETARKYESENNGVKIKIEILGAANAPTPTQADAEVVTILKNAVKEMRGLDAYTGGIGGGTCAAFLRRAGNQAVVWATLDEMAHQPNEYIKIQNLLDDAKVYAYIMATN